MKSWCFSIVSVNDRALEWKPVSFKLVKELKESTSKYGPTSPDDLCLVESLAGTWLTPADWFSLARSWLTGGQFLLYKSNQRSLLERKSRACRSQRGVENTKERRPFKHSMTNADKLRECEPLCTRSALLYTQWSQRIERKGHIHRFLTQKQILNLTK